MRETVKSGCYVFNKENNSIALIYRDYHNDYSFPKGHLEEGETLQECAIRETAEEIKRTVVIVDNIEPTVERYETPKGEKCVCYMYVAEDIGISDNTSTETHDLIWIPINEVANKLSYGGLVKQWLLVKDKIEQLMSK